MLKHLVWFRLIFIVEVLLFEFHPPFAVLVSCASPPFTIALQPLRLRLPRAVPIHKFYIRSLHLVLAPYHHPATFQTAIGYKLFPVIGSSPTARKFLPTYVVNCILEVIVHCKSLVRNCIRLASRTYASQLDTLEHKISTPKFYDSEFFLSDLLLWDFCCAVGRLGFQLANLFDYLLDLPSTPPT